MSATYNRLMGVITFLLLGGFAQLDMSGFAQNNMSALMAGDDASTTVHQGLSAAVQVLNLADSPYGGYVSFVRPKLSYTHRFLAFSLGYIVVSIPGGEVRGVPVSLDASANFGLLDHLLVRPRISLLGPARFSASDPYYTYDLSFTGGGGIDAIYDPFNWKVRPIFLLGGSLGYATGTLESDLSGHSEPLEGFGFGGNAGITAIWQKDKWGLALGGRISYGGTIIPDFTLSFLW